MRSCCYVYSSIIFILLPPLFFFFFFFNDTATTEIYTLSLHDALPILSDAAIAAAIVGGAFSLSKEAFAFFLDRKSTRLNSSHSQISYAVFCLKKKKKTKPPKLRINQDSM